MLELPEAVTLTRQINQTLAGKRVVSVEAGHTPHGFAFYQGDPMSYPLLLEGETLERAEQWGGRVELCFGGLQLELSDGVNLRYLAPRAKMPQRHQLYMGLEDGCALVGTVQMYGGIWLYRAGEKADFYHAVAREKPSPLSGAFDEPYFAALWAQAKPTLSAKALLCTEQRIPGLGNGCLHDILFRASIHPKRRLESMGGAEQSVLFQALKATLTEMAQEGGRDTEKDLYGQAGGYQSYLSAKTWRGVCPHCGGPITRQAYLGGNVYFCGHCQPLVP